VSKALWVVMVVCEQSIVGSDGVVRSTIS